MKINLLARTPDAVKVAFTAIRSCYSPQGAMEIWDTDFDKYKQKNDDHIRLIKQIVNHGHTSTLEHISFTFGIEGVSRVLLAQLTRHRVGFSYSVQSQRYVKMPHGYNLPYYKPDFDYVDKSSMANFGEEDMIGLDDNAEPKVILNEVYEEAMMVIKEYYDILLGLGLKAEDARMVLPNATLTNLVMTVNLRALLDFYKKRNPDTHAQAEISEFAENIKNTVVEAEP